MSSVSVAQDRDHHDRGDGRPRAERAGQVPGGLRVGRGRGVRLPHRPDPQQGGGHPLLRQVTGGEARIENEGYLNFSLCKLYLSYYYHPNLINCKITIITPLLVLNSIGS